MMVSPCGGKATYGLTGRPDVKLGGTAGILLNILTSRPARALAAHDDR
jgi:hypothetical protein